MGLISEDFPCVSIQDHARYWPYRHAPSQNKLSFSLPPASRGSHPSLHTSMTRLILGRKKYEQVTPMLVELHWLPVKERIVYKICLFVSNASTIQLLNICKISLSHTNRNAHYIRRTWSRNIQQCRRELERDHSHLMLENTGIFCQRNQDSPERLIGSHQI